MKSSDVYGLVLAGGRSARMGHDKSLIEYHGKPQREYLFELLSEFCSRVFTSCRQAQGVPASLNPIYDEFQFESPLNGILSALKAHPGKAWLTVAVDMPHVDRATLKLLINNRQKEKLATCFYATDSKPEPLLTLWEPACLEPLTAFVAAGKISPREFLMSHNIGLLQARDSRVLTNVNSEEELRNLISPK